MPSYAETTGNTYGTAMPSYAETTTGNTYGTAMPGPPGMNADGSMTGPPGMNADGSMTGPPGMNADGSMTGMPGDGKAGSNNAGEVKDVDGWDGIQRGGKKGPDTKFDADYVAPDTVPAADPTFDDNSAAMAAAATAT